MQNFNCSYTPQNAIVSDPWTFARDNVSLRVLLGTFYTREHSANQQRLQRKASGRALSTLVYEQPEAQGAQNMVHREDHGLAFKLEINSKGIASWVQIRKAIIL